MKHHYYSLIISLLSSIYTFMILTSSTILDISDYTFYYTSYHYLLPSLTTNTSTLYNHQLSLNITISFNTNISITLTNHQALNLLSNNNWNEISFISRANTDEANTNEDNSDRRRLGPQTEYSEDKQYEGVPHGKNWLDAGKYCKATRRGHLATILDEDDNYQVATECSKLGTRWHCWLGLKRPFTGWINGEPVGYVNWLPGEPNNWGGDENCVEIYGSDEQIGFEEMWNDLKCDMMRGIVCERPPREKPPPKPRKLMCDCQDINYNRDEYLRRRLAKKGKCGCKPLTKKALRKRKKQRLRWARIRAYARWKRRQRERKRRAIRKMKRQNARRRRKWRTHLRFLRRKRRGQMKRDYRREMKLEKRRDAGYSLLNKLIASALGNKHSKGARFGAASRRRMVDADFDADFDGGEKYDMVSRCKVMDGGSRNYEICVNYNFGDKFLSVDVRFVDRKVLKGERGVDFRRQSGDLVGKYRHKHKYKYGYHIRQDGEMFDPVEGNLGYAVWKYELMDWHSFKQGDVIGNVVLNKGLKYGYGEYKKFDDYIHYFHEYELYFNNNRFPNDMYMNDTIDYINDGYIECSERIDNIPFKMCMKHVRDDNGVKDTILYFEKDVNDEYDINAKYSFQVKEYIDNKFENNMFYFNNDENWDEISVINIDKDMKWVKKCSYKLLIAKICIEQFHINDSRGSIKFQSKNKYNDASV